MLVSILRTVSHAHPPPFQSPLPSLLSSQTAGRNQPSALQNFKINMVQLQLDTKTIWKTLILKGSIKAIASYKTETVLLSPFFPPSRHWVSSQCSNESQFHPIYITLSSGFGVFLITLLFYSFKVRDRFT